MDQQNIDRLFREKLDQLEVQPSHNSWHQVEGLIQSKKRPLIYWVAASVAVLMVSWAVWVGNDFDKTYTPIASEVSYPEYFKSPEFVLPEIEHKTRKETAIKKNTVKRAFQNIAMIQENAPDKAAKEEPIFEAPQPETKTLVAGVEMEQPEIINSVLEEDKAKIEFKPVKITYIASNSNAVGKVEEKSDTTGVFKKVIAFAGKIDPGDMLADIKTAKDNLLNGGLKNKKERSSL